MYSASIATDLDFSEREFNSVSFDLDNVNEELMNASLGTGIDLIPGLLLRHTSSSLSFHVLKLLEAIVEFSVYPLWWKRAVITPIYKCGNKSLIVSYRPFSILPKLSLVFEKLLFKFLYPISKNQLSNYQFGFRKGRSTVTQLLLFLNELYTNLDNGEISYCFYLVFSKAFDKVLHSILLHKLSLFGIGGNLLLLLSSYLSNRVQCVKVGHFYSRWETIASEVPQGSVLGPLLFIVFNNDLPSVCLSSIMFLYADDSKAITTNLKNLQLDLNACISWAEQNLMEFNASKTELIAIGETSKQFQKIGGMSLSPSNVVNIWELWSVITWNGKNTSRNVYLSVILFFYGSVEICHVTYLILLNSLCTKHTFYLHSYMLQKSGIRPLVTYENWSWFRNDVANGYVMVTTISIV